MSVNGWLQILPSARETPAVMQPLVNMQLGEVIFGGVSAETNRRNICEIG